VAIVKELKTQVEQALVRLLHLSEHQVQVLSLEQIVSAVTIEPCRLPECGDFSCSVALRLALSLDLSAIELAHKIFALVAEQVDRTTYSVNVSSPGFINFSVTRSVLSSVLLDIHRRFPESDCESVGGFRDSASKNCYELCCSILKSVMEPSFDIINEIQFAPIFSSAEWQKCKLEYKSTQESFELAFDADPYLFARQKSLILMLDRISNVFDWSAQGRHESTDAHYGSAIAETFAKFYQGTRIFTAQPELTKARLGLVLAVKLVLEQTLRS
jgi:arginyl-tRNA synthetase